MFVAVFWFLTNAMAEETGRRMKNNDYTNSIISTCTLLLPLFYVVRRTTCYERIFVRLTERPFVFPKRARVLVLYWNGTVSKTKLKTSWKNSSNITCKTDKRFRLKPRHMTCWLVARLAHYLLIVRPYTLACLLTRCQH